MQSINLGSAARAIEDLNSTLPRTNPAASSVIHRYFYPGRIELLITAAVFIIIIGSSMVVQSGFMGPIYPAAIGMIFFFYLCIAALGYVVAPFLIRLLIRGYHTLLRSWWPAIIVSATLLGIAAIPILMRTHFEYPFLVMMWILISFSALAIIDKGLLPRIERLALNGSKWAGHVKNWYERAPHKNLLWAGRVWRTSVLCTIAVFLAFLIAGLILVALAERRVDSFMKAFARIENDVLSIADESKAAAVEERVAKVKAFIELSALPATTSVTAEDGAININACIGAYELNWSTSRPRWKIESWD